MENIYTIKESLIYSTLYVQTVPQNIYQAVSDPQIFKLITTEHLFRTQPWMSQSTPERISQKQINPDIMLEFQHKRFWLLNGEITPKMPLWKFTLIYILFKKGSGIIRKHIWI